MCRVLFFANDFQTICTFHFHGIISKLKYVLFFFYPTGIQILSESYTVLYFEMKSYVLTKKHGLIDAEKFTGTEDVREMNGGMR